MKRIGPILLLLVMLLLGGALGYVSGAYGVELKNLGLWQLNPSYQGIYLQAAADAYAKDPNQSKAADRLSFLCKSDGGYESALNAAQARYTDPQSRANLDQLNTLFKTGSISEHTDAGVCNYSPVDSVAPYARLAWIGILLAAVGIVGYGVFAMIRANEEEGAGPASVVYTIPTSSAAAAPSAAAPAVSGERGKATAPAGMPKPAAAAPSTVSAKSVAAAGAKISAALERTDFSTAGMEPPIVQFMTTYLHGDDLYDDSFSIETSAGEFLGECGMGISETLTAPGEAKKVTAFEVWLFDKNDIRTVTKVVMSDHSFNDDAIRAKLAPKGEAVLAKSGDKLTLETASLRVQARIVDLAYGTGPLPPNSFFERITIELAAWKKDGSAAAPAGSTPSSTPAGGLPNIG